MAKRRQKSLDADKRPRSKPVIETDEQIIDEIIEEFIEEEATDSSDDADGNGEPEDEAYVSEAIGYAPEFAAAAGYVVLGQSLATAATNASLFQQESFNILHASTVDAVHSILFTTGRRRQRQ